MVALAGIIHLIVSNNILVIQYAARLIPLITCKCLSLVSLSIRIWLTTAAGINEKPIATTNTMKIPLTGAAICLSMYVTGNGTVATLNLRLELPVACLRMASYIKEGYNTVASWEVKFKKVANLNVLEPLLAS